MLVFINRILILSFFVFSCLDVQAGFLSFFDASDSTNNEKISDAELASIVKEVNKSLPKVIDNKTVLKRFFVSPAGDLLVYDYELIGMKSDYSSKFIAEFNSGIVFKACSDASVLNMISLRSGLVYQYKDKIGDYITAFKINSEMCMKANAPDYLEFVGVDGGTNLYLYKSGRARVGDLISASSLYQSKPHYYRKTKIASMKFDLEIDCRRNFYKINKVSSYSKTFGVDLAFSEEKNDGWKSIGDLSLIRMQRDFLCK